MLSIRWICGLSGIPRFRQLYFAKTTQKMSFASEQAKLLVLEGQGLQGILDVFDIVNDKPSASEYDMQSSEKNKWKSNGGRLVTSQNGASGAQNVHH
jgi:hypothetical protein